MSLKILTRDVPPRSAWALEQAGIHPLLSRLFAARGIVSPDELDDGLAKLLAPNTLKGSQDAARLLADAMAANKRLCIVADYDCDGATACAVGLRGLRMLGASNVSYIVPDRVVDGYGLTAPIADRVQASGRRPVDHGRQRHCQRRRRGPSAGPGLAGLGHRPSLASSHSTHRRSHCESESSRLRI